MAAVAVMWIGLFFLWYWVFKAKPKDYTLFNVYGVWFLFIISWVIYEDSNIIIERRDIFTIVMFYVAPIMFFILGFFSKRWDK